MLDDLASRLRSEPWALTLLLTLGPTVTLAALHASSVTSYRALVQEDGLVEWATVVALVAAIPFFLWQARKHRLDRGSVPWFSVGLAAFCFLFAGEEISWGQRAIAYQPPPYFLEHNTQQELNIHNLFKQYLRTKYILMVLLAGWGIALPLLSTFSSLGRRLLSRVGVLSPPLAIVPGMAAILAVLITYPWPFTGEVAECVFAVALFATAVTGSLTSVGTSRVALALGLSLIMVLGWSIPGLVDVLFGDDEARIAAAELETRQLASDWLAQLAADEDLPSGCGTHIRVYTWVEKHGYDAFRTGSFASDTADAVGGADAVRREYFLDPWNNAYWVRHVCRDGQRVIFYSFGPNRRRDSTRRKVRPDDIGGEVVR